MSGRSGVRLGSVVWGPTLVVNFERLVAASLVWCGIALAMSAGGASPPRQALVFLLAPLAFPVFAPFAAAMQWLSNRGVPLVGWIALAAMLFLVLGDPPMWLLHRLAPRLVPVDRYRFFDRHLLIFVTASAPHSPVAAYGPRVPSPPCPQPYRPYNG